MSIFALLPYLLQKEEENNVFKEGSSSEIKLSDGHKLILTVEKSAKKSAKKPLTEDQVRLRIFLSFMLLFFFMLVCLIFTFFEKI